MQQETEMAKHALAELLKWSSVQNEANHTMVKVGSPRKPRSTTSRTCTNGRKSAKSRTATTKNDHERSRRRRSGNVQNADKDEIDRAPETMIAIETVLEIAIDLETVLEIVAVVKIIVAGLAEMIEAEIATALEDVTIGQETASVGMTEAEGETTATPIRTGIGTATQHERVFVMMAGARAGVAAERLRAGGGGISYQVNALRR
jgi:hypothetical protein